MILAVCLNPTFQNTMVFSSFLEGEVNRCNRYRLDPSGKGVNVSRVITQLGGDVLHLTHLGGYRRQELIDMLQAESIHTIWADSGSPIRTCTTIIHEKRGTTTELIEEPLQVAPTTEAAIRELFSQHIRQCSVLVISGTRAPGYSRHLYADMVQEAKSAHVRVILDVKGEDLTSCLVYSPDVIKPNLSEFASTFMPGHTVFEQQADTGIKDSVIELMKRLYEANGTAVVLTRGRFPTWLYDSCGFTEIPVRAVQAVNTVGCGDAFTAGLAWGLHEGKPLREAAEIATDCAARKAALLRPGSILE